VDVLGSVLVTAALMLGVYGIVTASDSGWMSAHTIGFGGAAIALLAAFLVLEWRLSNPIMPLRVLTSRSLTGASVARAFLFAGMFTNFFIGALYLQHIHGFSAFTTGLAFLPTTLVIGVLSAGVSRRLMARFGPRNLLVAGMTIIVAGLAVLSQAGPDASYFPTLFIAYLLLGSGAGTSFLPLLTISMSEVAPADAGLASGFSNVTMQVGGALGLAALGTISTDHAKALFAQGYPMPVALTGGYQLGFVLAAVSVAAGLAVVLTVLRGARPAARRQTPATADLDETEVEAA
jgi:predicted MFS family arabinose efflux permease